MLSKACKYAIKSLIFISAKNHHGKRVTVKEVATAIDSPPAFTSKILQQLVSTGILHSIKGMGGGFEISEEKAQNTTIIQIIKAIECSDISSNCFLGLPNCSDSNPCPVHNIYAPIREQLNMNLLNVTLNQIIQNQQFATYLKKR